eukprot:GHVU01202610.1.p4 GENE.GHVU01202610.1~~GHVU01202610.1.p4  ORF type:complete len:105 (+),score=13.08 GHVU01202610.1:198-512(+)
MPARARGEVPAPNGETAVVGKRSKWRAPPREQLAKQKALEKATGSLFNMFRAKHKVGVRARSNDGTGEGERSPTRGGQAGTRRGPRRERRTDIERGGGTQRERG